MGAASDKNISAQLYRALTHDELVARLVTRDEQNRVLREALDTARDRVKALERAVAVGRNRI